MVYYAFVFVVFFSADFGEKKIQILIYVYQIESILGGEKRASREEEASEIERGRRDDEFMLYNKYD